MRESCPARAMRSFGYRLVSSIIHQPRLLRLMARLSQQQPWFGRVQKAVASRADVIASFERQLSFSSTAHRPNLVAGDFVMGMPSGARHTHERQLLDAQFPPAADFGREAAQESRRRIEALLAGPAREFDLIGDYMVPVAWQGIGGAFGDRLPALAPDDPMLMNLRYLGAHLIVGPVATESVQRRARESAAAVNAWVRGQLEALHRAWNARAPASREEVARNVVGLLWVGHPATAQSGGLIMQELLARRRDPKVRGFADRVRAHADPWSDPALRREAMGHVLEALRLRPPFPILSREVPRETLYGDEGQGRIAAGSKLTLLGIGAMSDPAATADPLAYHPGREFADPRDRFLMFGWAGRQCPGRDPVVEILSSALLGLMRLPQLDWADPWWRRLRFDGPIISAMRLRFRGNPKD